MELHSLTKALAPVLVATSLLLGCDIEPPPPPPILAPVVPEVPSPPNRSDPACEVFAWPLTAERAAAFLKRTHTFAGSGVGVAGVPPPQMAAFQVLMDQPNAGQWFEHIAGTGGVAGRLYALAAFQLLDPERAFVLGAELRASRDQVNTSFGCIFDSEPVTRVAETVERHSVGESFRASRERTYEKYRALRVTGACL